LTTPSPPSTRPSGAPGRRSSAFVREDSGRGRAVLQQNQAMSSGWRPATTNLPLIA
jgi:hypothetical protein